MKWVTDQHCSQRSAADDDQFRRLDENFKVPVFHQISTDDCADNHEYADNGEHEWSYLLKVVPSAAAAALECFTGLCWMECVARSTREPIVSPPWADAAPSDAV